MNGSVYWLKNFGHHSGGERMTTRQLHQSDGATLEFIEAQPSYGSSGPPVLFLHGAFCGAWTWGEVFQPFFARRGRQSGAVSLRGHGDHEDKSRLGTATLSEYLADARRAFAEFREAPVVIGHSLGGLIAQMLIGQVAMRALVLLGSLPPEGLFFESPRLALTDPRIWLGAVAAAVGLAKPPIVMAATELLFSEGLPRELVRRYARRMAPEAPRALAEAHLPGPVFPAVLFGVPTLVVGGTEDRLVWQASTRRTALYHGAVHETAVGQGHFLMLDPGAETVARGVLDWLDRQGA
jgi:pimeloyl-ACP methyl ester carboxylesterase